jgi:hypothetical protein
MEPPGASDMDGQPVWASERERTSQTPFNFSAKKGNKNAPSDSPVATGLWPVRSTRPKIPEDGAQRRGYKGNWTGRFYFLFLY